MPKALFLSVFHKTVNIWTWTLLYFSAFSHFFLSQDTYKFNPSLILLTNRWKTKLSVFGLESKSAVLIMPVTVSLPLTCSGYHHSLPSTPYNSTAAPEGQRLPPSGTLSSEYLNHGGSQKVLLLVCNTAGSGQQAVRWVVCVCVFPPRRCSRFDFLAKYFNFSHRLWDFLFELIKATRNKCGDFISSLLSTFLPHQVRASISDARGQEHLLGPAAPEHSQQAVLSDAEWISGSGNHSPPQTPIKDKTM